jgi:predicted flap endonuclease-1-like 5' DNA nuclease
MEQLTEFIDKLPSYAGIFALMLSTFLIGYFSAWGMLKVKYQRLLKRTVRKSSQATSPSQQVKDIDVIFTEIKPKIIKVVKEAQEEIEHQKEIEEDIVEAKLPSEVAENTRTSYITYTHNKPKLNFDNFGHADASDVQDLTQINGIGPYIEQKLNEIGIYNFQQISRFKDDDIRVLTELIDFFPGRIERDNWVEQADELVN